MMIVFSEAQSDEIRGVYAAGRLDPVRVVPGLYQLPERLIAVFPDAGLDQYPTTADMLATAKAHMLAQVAAIRWGKCQLMSYDGETAAYAQPVESWLPGRLMALDLDESDGPVTVKLAPGAFRSMTRTELAYYGLAAATHVQACYDHEAALSSQIDAAADIGALNAIDLEAGWP